MVEWKNVDLIEKRRFFQRAVQSNDKVFKEKVQGILRQIKHASAGEKDAVLSKFTQQFDQVALDSLQVTHQEIQDAYRQVSSNTLTALKEAIRRVTLFHEAQIPKRIDLETSPGVRCERRFLPVSRVGLYVPGGTAPLPSTVIMLGVPSLIAGCKTRVLATPPRKDQTIDPHILVAADLLGIQQIFKVGGAQAIASMAYGTESIPKVDKIYGPGNSWVTEAKLQVSQDPEGAACDLPAGPSEVMVIADATADASFIAADLLSQAEHGSDSQVILVSDSRDLIQKVLVELEYQLNMLPRKEIATQALEKSLLIEVSKIEDAVDICNEYGPEHLIIQLGQFGKSEKSDKARQFANAVENAGSVFLGPWTPESMGDYASGTNHVLPTYGFARALSGLTTESFMKSITFQEVTLDGLKELGPIVSELAQIEKLDGHKNAVQIRLRKALL
jgi:histidinol dehydrogenase